MSIQEFEERGLDAEFSFSDAKKIREEYLVSKHEYQLEKIPVYRELARSVGLGKGASPHEIRLSMWFHTNDFKPPPEWVKHREYEKMTQWIAKMYHDQSWIDMNFEEIDCLNSWLDALDEQGLGVLHSSGTSGNFSYVPWDFETRSMFEQGMKNMLGAIGLMETGFHFVGMLPTGGYGTFACSNSFFQKLQEQDLATFYPAIRNDMSSDLVKAIRDPNYGDWKLRLKVWISSKLRPRMMKKYYSGALDVIEGKIHAADSKPIFLGGAPFQIMDLVELAEEQGREIGLPDNSAIMFGGGWKHVAKGALNESDLVMEVQGFFGENVALFDTYGMAEGGFTAVKQCQGSESHYYECAEGNYHLPHYMDPFVMDEEGEVVQEEAEGRLGYSLPLFNRISTILTDDLVSLDIGCRCGYKGFVLRGIISRSTQTIDRGCGTSPEDYVG